MLVFGQGEAPRIAPPPAIHTRAELACYTPPTVADLAVLRKGGPGRAWVLPAGASMQALPGGDGRPEYMVTLPPYDDRYVRYDGGYPHVVRRKGERNIPWRDMRTVYWPIDWERIEAQQRAAFVSQWTAQFSGIPLTPRSQRDRIEK